MKKNYKYLSLFVLVFCMFFVGNSQTQGRLAVVADGNYRDSDDIAATPVSLAILSAFGLESRLVHYSHSCDLQRGSGDPGGDFREREMQTSSDGTASRWGGFGHINTFYNAIKNRQQTINDLTSHINNSSNNDPLWIIEAGEPDIIYDAVKNANASKRNFIYIVTHHPANDRGDFHDLDDVMALGIPNGNLKRIPDQNTLLKKNLNDWHWARDHGDDRIKWLWDRGFVAQTQAMNYPDIRGKFDCSDAGMIYYWATLPTGGDKRCDVPKLKDLFLKHVDSGPNEQPQGSFIAPAFDTIEVGYTELVIEVDASDPNQDSIRLTLYIDGNEIRSEGQGPFQWGLPNQPEGETLDLEVGEHLIEVEIKDDRGAATTVSKVITVTRTLSTDDIEDAADRLVVYPNPTRELLTLKSKSKGTSEVIITDLLGKVALSRTLNSQTNTLDLSKFSSGIYLVTFKDEIGIKVFKVLKQ